MNSVSLSFKNDRGYALSARFNTPDGALHTVALFAHCFTCTKNINAVRRITQDLVRRGIAVLSFDFTGLGGSEGEFSESAFGSQTRDIVCAAQYVYHTYNIPVTILIGHSLGGTAALYASRALEDVKGVVTIGSPYDPAHVTHLFSNMPPAEQDTPSEVCISGRPFQISAQFVKDLRSYPPAQWAHEIKKEVLLLHSPVDQVVGIENAEKLFGLLRHPKSYVSLNKADHMLSSKDDARFAASVIAGWAEKFFAVDSAATLHGAVETSSAPQTDGASQTSSAPQTDGASQTSSAPQTDSASQTDGASKMGGASCDTRHTPSSIHQVVAQIEQHPFATAVGVRNTHALVADEPTAIGGTDSGPTPFEYLLTALATCTVMTLQVYSKRKSYTLTHAAAHCDYQAKPTPRITRLLEVSGTFNAAEKEHLLSIADLCPVHKLLAPSVEITTSFLEQ